MGIFGHGHPKDQFELVSLNTLGSQETLEKQIEAQLEGVDAFESGGRGDSERQLCRKRPGKGRHGWTSFWLKMPTLSVFVAAFGAMLIALEILYYFAIRNHGLSTNISNNHYFWTYGPTAVLSILAALWRNIDFRAKQITPWAEMAKGPTDADRSILLDYVQQANYLMLPMALKRKHFLVFLSISGVLLITVMTVLSTGLLLLEQVTITEFGTNLIATDMFNGSAFNSSITDSQPTYTLYGVYKFNMTYPTGTTKDYAFQSFHSPDTSNATLMGGVDAFSADLDCEVGNLTYTDGSDLGAEITPLAQYYNTTVETPGCLVTNAKLDAPNWIGAMNVTGYYGKIQSVNCTGQSGDSAGRLLIAMAYSSRNGRHNSIEKSSSLVCKPSYRIRSANVTLRNNTSSTSRLNISIARNAENRTLTGVSAWDLARGVIESLGTATSLVPTDYTSGNILMDPFFYFLSQAGGNVSTDHLLNDTFLLAQSRSVYSALTSQLAKRHLMSKAEEQFMGHAEYDVDRLMVKELSLRLMELILVVLIVITLGIWFLVPRGVVSRDPASIGALATILVRSPDVSRMLEGTGASTVESLQQLLSEQQYQTTVYEDNAIPEFCIEATPKITAPQVPKIGNVKKPLWEWWRPIAVELWGMIVILALPIVFILVLEGVYRLSIAHSGIADITDNQYLHYLWVYIPAWSMTLIATLFSMLDSAVKVFQPFHVMHVAASPATTTISENPVGKALLHALWNATRKRQFVVWATTVSVLFAPLLTIAVSGLFTAANVNYSHEIGLRELSWFNSSLTTGQQSLDPEVGALTSLVVAGNLSYPQWTWDELALPEITTLPFSGKNKTWVKDATVLENVQLPAIRAALNCTVVSKDLYFNATPIMSPGDSTQLLSVNISTPDGCGNSGRIGEYVYLSSNLYVPVNGYFGQLLDMDQDGCPQFWGFFGEVSPNNTKAMTTVGCSGYLQEISANLTFSLPDYQISSDMPPVINDTAPRFFSNQSQNFLSQDFQQITSASTADADFDPFFQAMIYGTDGVPASEMAQNETLLLQTMEHVYRMYMAQRASMNLRMNVNLTSSDARNFTGVFLYPYRVRLQMSQLSTRILQGVLALMFICAAVAYVTMDVRKVLTKEPSSIAAVGSLLAGSALLDQKSGLIPPGAEWWGRRQSKQNGLFEGLLFSLGWWGPEGRIHVPDGQATEGRFGIEVLQKNGLAA